MSIRNEWIKLRRTGFVPAFVIGGMLASAVPIIQTAVRTELFAGKGEPSFSTLLLANWQMLALFHALMAVSGACLCYHAEYADNAMQKIRTLPVKESGIFFAKFFVLAFCFLPVLAMEGASFAFCAVHWLGDDKVPGMDILSHVCYAFILLLPAVCLSLFFAGVCKNMWVPLGTGVICVFLATMLPHDFAPSLFPFALPFQYLAGKEDMAWRYVAASVAETLSVCAAWGIFQKIRRFLA